MTLLRLLFLALSLSLGAPALAAGDAGWFYRGSDIPPDREWRFGTLPNGVRYAVRRNTLPAGQVSVRVRIAAGALHEEDQEQGWAHLVEHLAFRGSKSFGDLEGRSIWQTLGASFGSDTNAFTSPTQTVYQLDLPNSDPAKLDRSLHVLAEMVDTALFDPAAVDAERRIVFQEKGRRPELAVRMMETSMPFFYGGLKFATRDTIGTDATLAAATPQGLRAFYERWYRPDRTSIVMVGDADPAAMEAAIAKRFGDWKPSGAAPREPDYGRIVARNDRAAGLAYAGAPYTATTMWLRPFVASNHTLAREREDFARSLGMRIFNRRLEAKARNGAAYVGAGIGAARQARIADTTTLGLSAREAKWQESLAQAFAIVSDGVTTPPAQAEIDREIQNQRAAAASALEAEKTLQSQQRAQQLIGAIDDGDVVANAPTMLAMIDRFAPQMTPAIVGAAMRDMFKGLGPRVMLLSPKPVAPAAIDTALAAAEKAAPAARQGNRLVSFDNLPRLGPPGRELSRQRIDDLGVTIVRFANGASLTFKQTEFEKGSVAVQLRFGSGAIGLPNDRRTPAWLSGIVGLSGLADLDLDGVERLLTGRRMNLSFGMAEDAYVLSGSTTGRDLPDQLRLLATKLAHPRWDEPLLQRFKAGALDSYDLSFSSASARAGREVGAFTRGNDLRWRPTEKAEIAAVDLAQFKGFLEPRLGEGPIEAIIVGDVDLETAISAMTATVAALPQRRPSPIAPALRAVAPPTPNRTPQRFTHTGDKNQAYALIGWTTFGGVDRITERRALSVAANILQFRLIEQLREAEGATYSPSAIASSSEELPGWGTFHAAAEIRPESSDTFFRIARQVVADLAARPASPDEFARAQNPVVSGVERRLKTNAYWLNALEDWVNEPALIGHTRSYLADYRALTAEDVRRAVAAHVADAGDWSMLVLPDKDAGGGD